MTKFSDIINPPTEHTSQDKEQLYRNLDSAYQFMDGLLTISNPAQTLNSDFSTLGPGGMTPITQADGDNAEFSSDWFVVGASQATYTLTPTTYPNNSPVVSASPYFINVNVSGYSGSGLYFYQQQMDVIRKFQTQFVTLTLNAFNNLSTVAKLRFDLDFYLNPTSIFLEGGAIYLQPGNNQISTTLKTPTLRNETVGSGSYVEFQLVFLDLPSGSADFDLYSIKAEFGKISTSLQ